MADEEVLRTLLLQSDGGALLVPDTAMAELIARPDWMPLAEGGWVLGRLEWRTARVPLVSLAALFGTRPRPEGEHVAVMNTAASEATQPRFYGLLLTALPRLLQLQRADLDTANHRPVEAGQLRGVLTRYEDTPVLVPDLASVEQVLPTSA